MPHHQPISHAALVKLLTPTKEHAEKTSGTSTTLTKGKLQRRASHSTVIEA